jgi:hypothetical protein
VPRAYEILNPALLVTYHWSFPSTLKNKTIFLQNSNHHATETKTAANPNERQFAPNQRRPIIKNSSTQEPLLSKRQPQIMPAARKQQQYYPNQPAHLQQPFLQNQFVQVK